MIVSIISFYYTIVIALRNPPSNRLLAELTMLVVCGLPFIHNLFIIFIYRKYYPEKEILKSHKIFNKVLSILCLLDLLLILLINFSLIMYIIRKIGDQITTNVLILFSILSITIVIQVTGGFRLIKIVRENARLQLEASFA